MGWANTPPLSAILDLNDAGIVVALGDSREGSGSIEICIHNDGRCTPSPAVVCRRRGITLLLLLLLVVLLAYTRWKYTATTTMTAAIAQPTNIRLFLLR